jgi:putative transposase
MQAAKVKKKRHSRVEIATKLAEANDLATQGKLQSEIARTLGVSVMTLHRWRKALLGVQAAVVAPHDTGQPNGTRGADDRIAELQLEISRLRRLVTDSASWEDQARRSCPESNDPSREGPAQIVS